MDVVYDERALRELEQASQYYAAVAGEAKADEIIARIRSVIVARARVGFGKAAFYNVDDDVYEVPVPAFRMSFPTNCIITPSSSSQSPIPSGATDPDILKIINREPPTDTASTAQ
jgi:hypothetical protein